MNFPADVKYTKNDEWVRPSDSGAEIGISDYAQDSLSDIVYLEVAVAVGDEISKGDVFGTVESVKAASDLYTPVSGKVVEVNEALLDTPELINSDPYGAAWMVKLELTNPGELDELLDSTAYQKDTEERDH